MWLINFWGANQPSTATGSSPLTLDITICIYRWIDKHNGKVKAWPNNKTTALVYFKQILLLSYHLCQPFSGHKHMHICLYLLLFCTYQNPTSVLQLSPTSFLPPLEVRFKFYHIFSGQSRLQPRLVLYWFRDFVFVVNITNITSLIVWLHLHAPKKNGVTKNGVICKVRYVMLFCFVLGGIRAEPRLNPRPSKKNFVESFFLYISFYLKINRIFCFGARLVSKN